jgi:hypothetical protein
MLRIEYKIPLLGSLNAVPKNLGLCNFGTNYLLRLSTKAAQSQPISLLKGHRIDLFREETATNKLEFERTKSIFDIIDTALMHPVPINQIRPTVSTWTIPCCKFALLPKAVQASGTVSARTRHSERFMPSSFRTLADWH